METSRMIEIHNEITIYKWEMVDQKEQNDVLQQEAENYTNDEIYQCELDASERHINALPNELLFKIISYCDDSTRYSLEKTSIRFFKLVNEECMHENCTEAERMWQDSDYYKPNPEILRCDFRTKYGFTHSACGYYCKQ